MIIYSPSNVAILNVDVDDTSYRFKKIMGEDELHLEFSLTEHIELPIGAYCEFLNERYTLLTSTEVTIKHRRSFEYSVTMHNEAGRLSAYRLHNIVDGRLKFDLTETAARHLKQIVDNLEERFGEGTWNVGPTIESKEKLISYNHTSLLDALNSIASTFETEWEINGTTISLGKVEYGKDDPLKLSYNGDGAGLEADIKRTSPEGNPIERLYVQGGDRNIVLSDYAQDVGGSKTLRLPRSLTFSFDGKKFSGEPGFDASKAQLFRTDAKGYAVMKASATAASTEDSLDLSDIYPKRVGTVSGVRFVYRNTYYTYEELIAAFPTLTAEDWDAVQVDIIDDSIPDDLNFSAKGVQIPGEKLTLIFQSGNLSGREFDVNFIKNVTPSGKPGNRFELVKAGIDGVNMPTKSFLPHDGDTYAVFHCFLPSEYIASKRSDGTWEGAEYDMLREAAKYLYEHMFPTFAYDCRLDGRYAKRNWANISGKIRLGGYVEFTDPSVQPTAFMVRITSVKNFVNNPHAPEIELSNNYSVPGLVSSIKQIDNTFAHTDEVADRGLQYTRRSFRQAQETSEKLAEYFENFDKGINPVYVQTMQMLVGDEALQYLFYHDSAFANIHANPFAYIPATRTLSADGCYLRHMTLGIKSVTSEDGRASEAYKSWQMTAKDFVFDETMAGDAYYIYAKCPENGTVGTFEADKGIIRMGPSDGYYYFLCGILNSEVDSSRSFAPMWGFTEILPGQITTSILRSANGQSYFDLENNVFALANLLKFNHDGKGNLILNRALTMGGDGETLNPLPCPRGGWVNTNLYYVGDIVQYQGSSYWCVRNTLVTGKSAPNPTNTTYWSIYASKGQDGQPGSPGNPGDPGRGIKTTVVEYASGTSGTYSPSSGWQTSVPDVAAGGYLWTRTTITYTDNTTTTSYSVSKIGSDGAPGAPGTPGAPGSTPFVVNIKASGLVLMYDDKTSPNPSNEIELDAVPSEELGVQPIIEWSILNHETGDYDLLDWHELHVSYSQIAALMEEYDYDTYTIMVDVANTHGEDVDYVTIGRVYGGTSTVNILLSNPSHTIAAGVTSVLEQQTDDVYVYGFKGNEQKAVTIGTISTGTTNVTATRYNNGTTSAYIRFTFKTGLSSGGTITIPVTCEGVTYNLKYNFDLAKSGKDTYSVTASHSSMILPCPPLGLESAVTDSVTLTALSGSTTAACTISDISSDNPLVTASALAGGVLSVTFAVGLNTPKGKITYVATVGGVSFPMVYNWTMSRNGQTGASLRGPSAYEAGRLYESGAAGEQYIDLVIYNENYYYCKVSHTSTAAFDASKWEQGDQRDFVATRILLAKKAAIDNLLVTNLSTRSVDDIDGAASKERIVIDDASNSIAMYDEDGNTKLVVTGKNIDVSSDSSRATISPVSRTLLSRGATPYTGSESITLATFSVSGGNNNVLIPNIICDIDVEMHGTSGKNTLQFHSYLTMDGVRVSDMVNIVNNSALNMNDGFSYAFNGHMSDGTHTLALYFDYSMVSGSAGDTEVSINLSAPNNTILVEYASELVTIGKNGISALFGSTTNKLEAIRDKTTGKVEMTMRVGGFGLRVTDTGIYYIKSNMSNWQTLV